MKRREFVNLSASAAIIALVHAHTALGGCSFKERVPGRSTLITSLRLLTIASLEEMKKFYGETMGLPVMLKNNELIVTAGETLITFLPSADKKVRPFYHFAFNIPENKIQKAFEWQRKRTPVIHPNPEGAKDQVVNFAHWNAHSIFFLDPAGNLLEYIARHDLHNAVDGEFSVKDILCASEIGMIVDDVIASGNSLKKEMDLPSYRDAESGFWPIGDESGLLLMIRKGRIWTGHPGQENETTIFKTAVTIRSTAKTNWDLPGYPYTISSAG